MLQDSDRPEHSTVKADLQEGYLHGQEVLKALHRRRLKLLGAAMIKVAGEARRQL